MLRRGQGEAKAPSVGADFLFKQTACHCVSVLVKSVYISKTLKLLQPMQTGILKLMKGTGEDVRGGVAHRAKQRYRQTKTDRLIVTLANSNTHKNTAVHIALYKL